MKHREVQLLVHDLIACRWHLNPGTLPAGQISFPLGITSPSSVQPQNWFRRSLIVCKTCLSLSIAEKEFHSATFPAIGVSPNPGLDVARVVLWAPQGKHMVALMAQLALGSLRTTCSGYWLICPLPGSQVTLLFCKWYVHCGCRAKLPSSFEAVYS